MSEEARMKKTIIKIAVCVVVFIASAFIIGGIMNQGHNNMTMEMAPATLPVLTMESGGMPDTAREFPWKFAALTVPDL